MFSDIQTPPRRKTGRESNRTFPILRRVAVLLPLTDHFFEAVERLTMDAYGIDIDYTGDDVPAGPERDEELKRQWDEETEGRGHGIPTHDLWTKPKYGVNVGTLAVAAEGEDLIAWAFAKSMREIDYDVIHAAECAVDPDTREKV